MYPVFLQHEQISNVNVMPYVISLSLSLSDTHTHAKYVCAQKMLLPNKSKNIVLILLVALAPIKRCTMYFEFFYRREVSQSQKCLSNKPI